MDKEKVKRCLDEIANYLKDNDEMALLTYYDNFSASSLIDEIWNVIVDGNDPNYYGY